MAYLLMKKNKFIILNNNSSDEKRTNQVGKEQVVEESNAKLLGVTIDEDQKWKTQISSKGGLIPSLNSRIFIVNRLKNALGKKCLQKITDSLYTS